MAGETILVIEDNVIQREGIAFLLREAGYNVLTAKDGREGLSWLRSEPAPDLILLDMMMPRGLDGWHFLTARKESPAVAAIPVLITTGITAASEEWVVALGGCGLLRKPFDADALLALVDKCLEAACRTPSARADDEASEHA
jgi:CheY-like chemotaxis protein